MKKDIYADVRIVIALKIDIHEDKHIAITIKLHAFGWLFLV